MSTLQNLCVLSFAFRQIFLRNEHLVSIKQGRQSFAELPHSVLGKMLVNENKSTAKEVLYLKMSFGKERSKEPRLK